MKFIIGIEGLGQGERGVLSRALSVACSGDIQKYKTYAYNSGIRLQKEAKPLLIVGHSFGGEIALNIARPGIDIVITLDPRPVSRPLACTFDSFLRYEMPFKARPGLKVINFYRRGFWLPGQVVIGAENHALDSRIGHMDVPRQPSAWLRICKEAYL